MRIRLRSPGHAAGLLSELNSCRQSRQYCDVLLQVGNRSFAAHRALLACAGTYFRSLFARAQASPTLPAFSLEFVSPANLEKVLTFIYTGEILTDLIDVGVLYELAERLGVGELVKACHATFPDLQASSSSSSSSSACKLESGPGGLVGVSAPSACSSAASCSSLSSSAGPSATPTPAAAAALPHAGGTPRAGVPLPLELKAEDVRSHLGYGQMENHLSGGLGPLPPGPPGPPGPPLQLKTEVEQQQQGAEEAADRGRRDACSFTDSSAQLGGEASVTSSSSSSGDPLGSLQVEAVEGGVMDVSGDGHLLFGGAEGEEGGDGPQRDPLPGRPPLGATEEEQWRELADDIIELSDDENYMEEEEEEEEEDEDDLLCVENGGGGNSSSQVSGSAVSCKACSASLPADVAALRAHAETHLTDSGLCRVCGALFSDTAASVAHALSHVGVQLFSCDMCHTQFCSQNKLLRHRRQAVTGYTLPQVALTGAPQCQGSELQCAVCTKALSRDFQAVREHLLSHVCRQSLSCGVCHLPQLSLCSLLWHTLTHLSVPIYTCPHCGHSFLDRPLLDRHMASHAEEAAAKERERERAAQRPDELNCFLCPQTFRSASAFQQHLGLHAETPGGGGGGHCWIGKRKADHPPDFPHPPPPPSSSSSSSSSSREVASLVKMSNLGFSLGMGFSLHPQMPSIPPGALANGSSELDRAAAAAGVRGKWYRCRYCGKRFAHSGEFTYHLRIHTGEKPYQCKVCLRFFRGRSTMICHLKTHAGALMYRCTVCGLYFSTLKLVSSHMELHKEHLPPDFNIEQTFMYNDHSKEPLPAMDV